MARQVVIGQLRVQKLTRRDGLRSWTIVWPEGTVHAEADRFLRRHDGSGTQRTYAYLLVDHLRWLDRECLGVEAVTLRDLERYMGIVGAEVAMPLGEPWRVGKRPYGRAALSTAAACLKGFYLHQAALGVNGDLGGKLDRSRLPSRADRSRSFLGHVKSEMPANPLAPRGPHRRHPKMLPDGARERLLAAVNSARDAVTVTWLADGGLRIGELCGLHLVDLHLRDGAACGQCRTPHVHVCHRPGQPQRGGGQDQASVAGPGRHGDRRADQAGQPGDGAHLLRVHDQRISARAGHGTGCCWSSCTARTRVSRGRRPEPGGCLAAPGNARGWAG